MAAFKFKIQILPDDYLAPADADVFMKMAKAGAPIKFVMVGQMVCGYSYWTTEKVKVYSRKPFASTPNIEIGDNGAPKKVSRFWALPVFDCTTDTVRVLEITQKGLQEKIDALISGNDYDVSDLSKPVALKISAKGAAKLTEYELMPMMYDSATMIPILQDSDLLLPGAIDALIFTAPATPATPKVANPGTPAVTTTAAQDVM